MPPFVAEKAAAVAHVAASAFGGLRFHGLRHSYVTRLAIDGVPVNVVRRVVGPREGVNDAQSLHAHPGRLRRPGAADIR